MSETKNIVIYDLNRRKCITFVQAAQDVLPEHIKEERNIMDIKLSKMQIIHLGNICKKGWGGYSKPSEDLEEMVKNGLLTKEAGPFGDVVYRPTNKGRGYINS